MSVDSWERWCAEEGEKEQRERVSESRRVSEGATVLLRALVVRVREWGCTG